MDAEWIGSSPSISIRPKPQSNVGCVTIPARRAGSLGDPHDRPVDRFAPLKSLGGPESLAGAAYSPLTLVFRDSQLEHDFREDRYLHLLGTLRLAMILGVVMYAVFGALDRILIPEAATLAWIIRFGFAIPLALGLFGLSYTRHFKARMEAAIVAIGLTGGLGIVVMIAYARAPGNYLYYAGLLLMVMYSVAMLRPRFPVATGVAIVVFVAYEATAILGGAYPPAILISNTFFFLSFNVVAMFASYSLERYMRSDFLQRRTIRQQNESLEVNLLQVEARRREAEAHAQLDPLTGLFNRRHFFSMLDYSCQLNGRGTHALSVLILDLDHFKQVNDTYGHLIGDQVLQSVSQILRFGLRQGDVVCRYGGEEFAVLLPKSDLETAVAVGERIRQSLAATLIPTDKGPITLTASVGAACLNEADVDLDALLERADRALYAAKNGGRNQVQAAPPPSALTVGVSG